MVAKSSANAHRILVVVRGAGHGSIDEHQRPELTPLLPQLAGHLQRDQTPERPAAEHRSLRRGDRSAPVAASGTVNRPVPHPMSRMRSPWVILLTRNSSSVSVKISSE
jgi:hypothetical protein